MPDEPDDHVARRDLPGQVMAAGYIILDLSNSIIAKPRRHDIEVENLNIDRKQNSHYDHGESFLNAADVSDSE